MIVVWSADVHIPTPNGESVTVMSVGPGKLVGELGVLRNVPRALNTREVSDLTSLRIGADEFLAVVEHGATTTFKLMQVVAGYGGK